MVRQRPAERLVRTRCLRLSLVTLYRSGLGLRRLLLARRLRLLLLRPLLRLRLLRLRLWRLRLLRLRLLCFRLLRRVLLLRCVLLRGLAAAALRNDGGCRGGGILGAGDRGLRALGRRGTWGLPLRSLRAGLAGSRGATSRWCASALLSGSGQLASGRGGGRGTDDEVRAENFQEQARRGSTAQGRHARINGFCQVRQLRAAEALGLGSEDFPAVSRRGNQPLLQGRRHRLDNHEIAQAVQQVNGKAAGLVAGLNDIID